MSRRGPRPRPGSCSCSPERSGITRAPVRPATRSTPAHTAPAVPSAKHQTVQSWLPLSRPDRRPISRPDPRPSLPDAISSVPSPPCRRCATRSSPRSWPASAAHARGANPPPGPASTAAANPPQRPAGLFHDLGIAADNAATRPAGDRHNRKLTLAVIHVCQAPDQRLRHLRGESPLSEPVTPH